MSTPFRTTVSEAGNTIEDVNAAWTTFQEAILRPEYERLRGLILDDDGVIDAAEQLQLRQAGVFTFEDFASRFIGIKDAAVTGITTAEDALASYIAESNFEGNVNAFRESLSEAGNTVADINTAWATFVANVLRPEYERLRGKILDDDGIIDATEELALRRAGVFTFEDFSGQFSGLRDTAITGIQTSEQALASFREGSTFTDNIDAFKATVEAVGATVESINQAIVDLQPVLQAEFERLRNEVIGEDGIISTAEQLILEQRGLDTFANFAQPFLNIAETAQRGVTARTAQSQSNLSQNAVQRADFALGGATDEADFEVRRGILRQATNTYYDNELERINGLMLSETELRNLREDNAFERERALQRIDDLDNGFAEDRIRREQEVADAAIEAAERAARVQAQLGDVGTRAQRGRQDLGIDFHRDVEDLFAEFGFNRSQVSDDLINQFTAPGFSRLDFQDLIDQGLVSLPTHLSGPFSRLGRFGGLEDISHFGVGFEGGLFGGIQDLLLGRERGLEDVGLTEDRGIADLLVDIAEPLELPATELTTAGTNLNTAAESLQTIPNEVGENVASALSGLGTDLAPAVAQALAQAVGTAVANALQGLNTGGGGGSGGGINLFDLSKAVQQGVNDGIISFGGAGGTGGGG